MEEGARMIPTLLQNGENHLKLSPCSVQEATIVATRQVADMLHKGPRTFPLHATSTSAGEKVRGQVTAC